MGIRIGHISSASDEEFRDAVTFAEDNGEQDNVSQDFYFFMPNRIVPPNADDQVLTAHLDSGEEVAIILGRVSSEKFKPPEWFAGLFHEWFSREFKQCYARYTDPNNDPDGKGNDGKFLFHNEDDTRAESKNFERVAKEKINDQSKGHKMDVTGDAEISATGKVTISGAAEVVIKSSANVTIQAGGQLNLTGSGGTINVRGNGSFVVNGVSLGLHAHNCTAPGSPSGPPLPTG